MEAQVQLAIARRRSAASLSSRALRGRWPYYLVGGAGLILHLALALPLYQWYDRVLAWIPLVVFLMLLRRYVLQPHKGIPLLVLIALQLYIFFSLPQFSQDDLALVGGENYSPSSAALTTAMVLVIIGELIFIFGYELAGGLLRKVSTRFYQISDAPTPSWTKVAQFYSVLSFLVYLTTALGVNLIPLSVRYLVTQLFNVYLGLAILLYLGYSFHRPRLVLNAYVLVFAMAFVGLLQGMLAAIVGPFVLLFLARWVWGRIFDFRWIVLTLVAVFIINPVKNEFRRLPSWLDNSLSTSNKVEDRLRDWSVSFERVWVGGGADDSVYMSTASRASDLISFTQAIDLVPAVIPYNAGEGMDDSMLFWIPRVLWPGKGSTTDLIYNRYALTFGYLAPEDIGRTAVGISVFAEGYWNFGVYGVLAFLFLSGALLGSLFGNNGKSEQVSVLMCITYVAPLILVLQALSVTMAAMPSFVIGVTLALRGLSLASRILNRVVSPATNSMKLS